jgi:hypothetical protein
MPEIKTQQNDASVDAFLNSLADERRRTDSLLLLEMMRRNSPDPAKMWGDKIIGFGSYTYAYADGSQGTSLRYGFSPRKQNLTLYGLHIENHPDLASRLGKYTASKACLYINKLADVDQSTLEELVRRAAAG